MLWTSHELLRGWLIVIGVTGAIVLAIENVIFAGVLGIAAGGVTCAVLRRSWSVKSAVVDALLAILVAGVAGYVLTVILSRFDVYPSLVLPIWGAAIVSVIGRHLLGRR